VALRPPPAIPGLEPETVRVLTKYLVEVIEEQARIGKNDASTVITTSKVVARAGQYLRVSPPPDGMALLLPPPTPENVGLAVTVSNEAPAGALRVEVVPRTDNRGVAIAATVNGQSRVTLTTSGLLHVVSNGVDKWQGVSELPLSDAQAAQGAVSAPIDATYFLETAHSSLTLARVGQNAPWINVDYTSASFVSWDWLGVGVRVNGGLGEFEGPTTRRRYLNFCVSNTMGWEITDDPDNDEVEIRVHRAHIDGDVIIPFDSNVSAFAEAPAKSVLINATNAPAHPTFGAGSAAFQYLRVNAANTGLEWATLSGHASTSIIYSTNTLERAALTGDVTAAQNSNATTIAANAVSNAKLAQMSARRIKGRADSAGTGDAQDLTGEQIGEILRLNNEVEDSTSTGTIQTYPIAPANNIVRFVVGVSNTTLRGATLPTAEEGQLIVWENNDGTGATVTFNHEDGSAAAAGNRFRCPGGANYALTAGHRIVTCYINTRHRIIATA
jgi:hypothetical protein